MSKVDVCCNNCNKQLRVFEKMLSAPLMCPACKQLIDLSAREHESADDIVKEQQTISQEPAKTKSCPYCCEIILMNAKKCKHCGEMLSKVNQDQAQAIKKELKKYDSGLVAASVLIFIVSGIQLLFALSGFAGVVLIGYEALGVGGSVNLAFMFMFSALYLAFGIGILQKKRTALNLALFFTIVDIAEGMYSAFIGVTLNSAWLFFSIPILILLLMNRGACPKDEEGIASTKADRIKAKYR